MYGNDIRDVATSLSTRNYRGDNKAVMTHKIKLE